MATRTKLLIPVLALWALSACRTHQIKDQTPSKGTFKVTIGYPNGEGKTFDMVYYEAYHMPMVAGFLGENLKYYEIDKGLSGRTPEETVPFLAMGHFYIADLMAYHKAIAGHRDTIVNDFKNYTNIQPLIQISELLPTAAFPGKNN